MRRPAAFLMVATLSVSAIVVIVHQQQKSERAEMHKGVVRDKERTRIKSAQKASGATAVAAKHVKQGAGDAM